MNTLQFSIECDVQPKKNQWHVGYGRIYKSKETNNFTELFAWQFKKQFPRFKPIEKQVCLTTEIYVKRDKDLDNLLNGLMDALQYAGILRNDRQVVMLNASKCKINKKEKPHVDVLIEVL